VLVCRARGRHQTTPRRHASPCHTAPQELAAGRAACAPGRRRGTAGRAGQFQGGPELEGVERVVRVSHLAQVASYEFTTLTCIPGVVRYRGAKIQLLDLPGIIEGAKDGKGRGRQAWRPSRASPF